MDSQRGWFVKEYVGISIVNLWGLLPERLRSKYRKRNRWVQWVGFTWNPHRENDGSIQMKLELVNPFKIFFRKLQIQKMLKKY
jgi:hypothetical protein